MANVQPITEQSDINPRMCSSGYGLGEKIRPGSWCNEISMEWVECVSRIKYDIVKF